MNYNDEDDDEDENGENDKYKYRKVQENTVPIPIETLLLPVPIVSNISKSPVLRVVYGVALQFTSVSRAPLPASKSKSRVEITPHASQNYSHNEMYLHSS